MRIDTYSGRSHGAERLRGFGGLDRTRRAEVGWFSDMTNMGTLEYPCAAPRGKRREAFSAPDVIDAIAAPDSTNVAEPTGFTGVSDGAFLYNGTVKSGSAELSHDMNWEIVRMGNLYIINGYNDSDGSSLIYYYNIDNDDFAGGWDAKSMDSLIVASGNDENGSYLATFRYGFEAVYEYTATSADGSKVIKNSDFFDTYGDPVVPLPNIFESVFAVGDEVEISGFPSAAGNFGQVWMYMGTSGTVSPLTSRDVSGNNTVDTDLLPTLDNVGRWDITNAYIKGFDTETASISGTTAYIHKVYFTLYNKYGEELDFLDMISDSGSQYCSGVSVSRRRRVFDHIGIHNGRLWGTVPTGNRIYISNSADLFDFTPTSIVKGYAGRLESDSPGVFTALSVYGAEMIAFKDDSITVIYGSSSYSTVVLPGIGCIDDRSVAATPAGLIFLSAKGFYIYSGSEPVKISEKLNKSYVSAVGGFDGESYYASAEDRDGNVELVTYDLRYGVWHRQDGFEASGFFRHRAGFYMAGTQKVYEVNALDGATETVEWEFTGVPSYSEKLGIKAVCELWIRAELAEDAEFTVYTSVDGADFREHSSFYGGGMRIIRCPVRAVMGGRTSWRISGSGEVVFYELELRTAEHGARYRDPAAAEQLSERFG